MLMDGSSGFDRLQNGNNLVFGESNLTHGDLLREHNQYVGRSLKCMGRFGRILTVRFMFSVEN